MSDSHSLGVVRVDPHLLPLVRCQPPVGPRLRAHADPADIVEPSGAPHGADLIRQPGRIGGAEPSVATPTVAARPR